MYVCMFFITYNKIFYYLLNAYCAHIYCMYVSICRYSVLSHQILLFLYTTLLILVLNYVSLVFRSFNRVNVFQIIQRFYSLHSSMYAYFFCMIEYYKFLLEDFELFLLEFRIILRFFDKFMLICSLHTPTFIKCFFFVLNFKCMLTTCCVFCFSIFFLHFFSYISLI